MAKFFSPETDSALYACPCGNCDTQPSNELLEMLDDVRERLGVPMEVTSGPRCREYNVNIGGAKYSEHMDGDAADIRCRGSRMRYNLVRAALALGINRIGIARSFVHLGVSKSNDNEVIWIY